MQPKILAGMILIMCLAADYASVWLHDESLPITRPYVYRQFVPLAARLLSLFGIPMNVSVIVVIVLCAAGFAFAAHYLYRSFYG